MIQKKCQGLERPSSEPKALSTCTGTEAEEFATKYGVKLGKAQQEGVFFVLPGDVVVSVIPETSWYTVKVEEEAQAAAK